MKVILAGYNLDAEVISGLKRGETKREDITPEVLSASYARISRDPRPIDELREAARMEVNKARKSNQNIIFKMGHHSVAEHAVFNFDLIGVSRLALEEIERFRLCSFTEKSQRYQTLAGNYLVPDEIRNTGAENLFRETIDMQNSAYSKFVKNHVQPEDARYITSLATLGQVGLTVNARNLELMFRRFASNPLSEINMIGRKIYDQINSIAPSIILFTNANPHDKDTYPELKKISQKIKFNKENNKSNEVTLVDHTKDADDKLLAALLHSSTLRSFKDCFKTAKKLKKKQKEEIIKTALKNMEFYDAALREFEYGNLTYEIIISAACFGQLKRHRMSTFTCQEYDPKLGVKIPPEIIKAGLKNEFLKVTAKTEKAFYKLKKKAPLAAAYLLTNSHRRRVLFACNARELYHISRLREDAHAQWDIQDISREMVKAAKKTMPLSLLTICGKDRYLEVYQEVFGKRPKVSPL